MRSIMSDRSSSDPLVDERPVPLRKAYRNAEKGKGSFADDSVYDYISDLCDAHKA